MFRKITGLLIALSIGLVSCADNGGAPQRRAGAEVEGFAVDAQIVTGEVVVYSFLNGVKGAGLGSALTDDRGFYSILLQAPDQPILIEIENGSYTEEASGKSVFMKAGQVLRALTFYESGIPVNSMVTPFTHLAAGLAEYRISQGTAVATAITEASSAISAMTGIDILTTEPHNITDPGNASTIITDELVYGFWAAGISSWTAEASGKNGNDPHDIWTSIAFSQVMYRDIREDGLLDGKGIDPESQAVIELGFGLVPIGPNTYRTELSRHMLAMVGHEANQSGIRFDQILSKAEGLSSMTHAIFGETPPIPLDTEGPLIVPSEPEGLFHNGTLDFSVTVSDAVGLGSVHFDLDGTGIGQAFDPNHPSILINTLLYSDGAHLIGVRAIDNLANESYRQLAIQFSNSGSSVNVLSPHFVNSSPTTLSGSYIDNGTGVKSIMVQGVPADIDQENKTWSVTIPIIPPNPQQTAAFVTTVPIDITDNLDIVKSENVVLTMDTIAPLFDPAPIYSNATFISGGQTFTQKLSFADSSDIPIRIETDHVSLNGTAVLEGPLRNADIPYVVLHVEDTNINGVFTPEDEITAQIQYSLDGSILSPLHSLGPVITTTNNFRFIVPLVSEFLHADWHQATPLQEHKIEVIIRDRAGNTANFDLGFFVEFAPPAPVITSRAINPFSTAFANRALLYGQVLQVSEYAITNQSDFALLFSLKDLSTHSVTNTFEDAIRIHQAQKLQIESWQAQFRFKVLNPQINGQAQKIESPNEPWSSISSLSVSFGNQNTQVISVPAPIQEGVHPLSADQLPSTVMGSWNAFHVSGADLSDVNYFGPLTGNVFIASYAYDKPKGNYFQRRVTTLYQSLGGHPFNQISQGQESQTFATDHFKVFNTEGERKLSVNGFFRLPSKATYTIEKFITTPSLSTYNDTEVGNAAAFASYTPKKYDKRIDWTINNQLEVQAVHDTGFAQAEDMIALNIVEGLGISTYTVSR